MRKTKILATLGPASDDVPAISSLLTAGADAFRINMSHSSHEEVGPRIERARQAAAEAGRPIPIFLDLRGPKLRVGAISGGQTTLEAGAAFILTTRELEGDSTCVSCDYRYLPRDAKPGARILLDDGQIVLTVDRVNGADVHCRIETGGVLKSNKGMALPGVRVEIPALTDKDIEDVAFGVQAGADGFLLSFVQRPEDIHELHGVMRARGSLLPVIAKIETGAALENLDGIAEAADAMLIARGDLGVELPIWKVPTAQRRIAAAAARNRKPVIVATEMLETMITRARPTRAEVSDVANAVFAGADVMMLSAETAVGRYPAQAVEIMAHVATEAEASFTSMPPVHADALPMPEAVALSAVELAHRLRADAILLASETGYTARIISQFRPCMPVIAITACPNSARLMSLCRGVVPVRRDVVLHPLTVFCAAAREILLESGMLRPGMTVVATNINRDDTAEKGANAIRVFRP